MNNKIINSPLYKDLMRDVEGLRDGLLALYLEHDELVFHICRDLKTTYMLKFGALEYNVYDWQCKVLSARRKTELARVEITLGKPVDIAAIDAQLDVQYAEYVDNLKKKMNDINEAIHRNNTEWLSKETTAELKKIYRAVVLRLHPDVNRDITKREQELFNNAVTAYKNGDIDTLRTIFLLIDKAEPDDVKTNDPIEELTKRKHELENSTDDIQKKISEIKASFPYNKKALLSDDSQIEKYTEDLNKLIADYKEAYEKYERQLKEVLEETP